jgi:hypothetical protein
MTSKDEKQEADRLWKWQARLLPFMIGSVSLLAIFFFVSSFIQLNRFNELTKFRPSPAVETAVARIDEQAEQLPAADRAELLRWKIAVILEVDVVRHRYEQVNATMQLRAWTRHMGFITGMMMTFLGAIFIMSKLSEQETRMSGEMSGVKGALATSSPGIVLAVLGTVLMLVTLSANYSFTTTDVPVYVGRSGAAPDMSSATLPPPHAIDEDPASEANEKVLFGIQGKGGSDESPRAPESNSAKD